MAELTRATIDAGHFVARYAQGRLSEAELEAFEDYCVLHPEIVDQVQTDRILISGLRHAKASRPSRFSRTQVLALAASALIAVFGLATWLWRDAPTVASPFMYRAGESLPALLAQQIVEAPAISMTRGSTSTAVSVEPETKALRLEFEPARSASASEYRVALAEEIDGKWLLRSELEHVRPENHAVPTVAVIVDLTRLSSTHLRITLAANGAADEFNLHVVGMAAAP